MLLPIILLVAQTGRAQTVVSPLKPIPLPPDLSLIHLDTPVVPAKAVTAVYGEIRAFGGDEDLVYTGIGVQYGLGNGWAGLLRGNFAGRDNFSVSGGTAAIRHGGNEVELAARYQSVKDGRFGGLVGVSFPDTAAQNDPVITLGVSAAFPLGRRATAYLNPKTVLLKDNTLLGLGIGVQARVSNSLSLLADVTPLLTGNNTRSTDDNENGKRERRAVYGIGLRYAPVNRPLTIDIGYATGTGRTTGSSLTPGLGGAGAFYAGLTFRR